MLWSQWAQIYSLRENFVQILEANIISIIVVFKNVNLLVCIVITCLQLVFHKFWSSISDANLSKKLIKPGRRLFLLGVHKSWMYIWPCTKNKGTSTVIWRLTCLNLPVVLVFVFCLIFGWRCLWVRLHNVVRCAAQHCQISHMWKQQFTLII